MKKILIVGNHSCANRGDAAILRGLYDFIQSEYPKYEITVCSRSPDSVKEIFGQSISVIDDYTKIQPTTNILKKILNKLLYLTKTDHLVLLSILSYYVPLVKKILPESLKQMIEEMKKNDFIFQVGGSFFVDLYGMPQFRLLCCALLAKKPICLVGHSLGPFGSGVYKSVSGWCFSKVNNIIIRDRITENLINKLYPKLNYTQGADTAWLVDTRELIKEPENKENMIGFTFRELSPFDKRLGLSQEKYEKKMALISEALIDRGYNLVYLSTCTSLADYHKNDRLIAEKIQNLISEVKKEKVNVVNKELTDIELGKEISRCKLLIGTRLHSCIIGINFGTPAIAIAYEHKSIGLYHDMGLSEFAVMLSEKFSETEVLSKVEKIENNYIDVFNKYLHEANKQEALAKEKSEVCLLKLLSAGSFCEY